MRNGRKGSLGGSRCEDSLDLFEVHGTRDVPLLGVVTAGKPWQADTGDETLSVPTSLWGGCTVFALRARGNSWSAEGIRDGDHLIVEPRPIAEDGQTVMAEVGGCVRIERFFHAASPAPGSRRCAGASRIIGIVVGLLRQPVAPSGRESSSCRSEVLEMPRVRCRPPQPSSRSGLDLQLALGAIDGHLARWHVAMERLAGERRVGWKLVRMARLGHDLQALRDWADQSDDAHLQRQLVAEANRLRRRMDRFARETLFELPELSLH